MTFAANLRAKAALCTAIATDRSDAMDAAPSVARANWKLSAFS